MSVLLDAAHLTERRATAAGPLRALAESLRSDLDPLLTSEVPIPAEKARLTRTGGRCPVHRVLLDFDPWSPREHRCPVCGELFRGEEHYRWWIMNYQLWLAERAVHSATLYALSGDAACGVLSRTILERYAGRYLDYPDRDNVLGPTRPFFSTYLESIWLLQLAVALGILEECDGTTSLGATVRDRLIAPSARLIQSYDEGMSNRQVWNNAALAAAAVLLDDDDLLERAVSGPSGLVTHSLHGLLSDGTWYEGENYHLFAHRGLWYTAAIAETRGWTPTEEMRRRFADAFVAPFATALPDFTFPSRRDSQYKVSLRQWRIAESCELGLARAEDLRLHTALAELYRDDIAPGDTGRARSTAEAERNLPPVRLTRASLGWKALLFARNALPRLSGRLPASAHLEGQGIAVIRRDAARVYVALDYGTSGGGHGHPDRLNLWLIAGDVRFLEDVGTGSYVDRELHWYRSTMAHNAPLADGRSQWRVDGKLVAWDERGGAGWISAEAEIAPGVLVGRTVVVMPGYLVDEVQWTADRTITLDLPWHLDAEFVERRVWTPKPLVGGSGVEDGFEFISEAENSQGAGKVRVVGRSDAAAVHGWLATDAPHEWWRCRAPGPPGTAGERRFLLQRARDREGVLRAVWSWSDDVEDVLFEGDRVVVVLSAGERHEHQRMDDRWNIAISVAGARSSIDLERGPRAATGAIDPDSEGKEETPSPDEAGLPVAAPFPVPLVASLDKEIGAITMTSVDGEAIRTGLAETNRPVHFRLGERHYRRSEQGWKDAGSLGALVAVAATARELVVEVSVRKLLPIFRPWAGENPLDNEHPDINSDGLQLYIGATHGGGRYYSWILVPDSSAPAVRVTARSAFGPPVALSASWRPTAAGYVIRCLVPRVAIGDADARDFTLDVIVNEIPPDRERRRGQLVLSGGRGEWVYLRGDRQEPTRALPFRIAE